MNLTVLSAKHSPGVTTLALALTCALADGTDDGPPVLFELDEAGGDLAARLGLPSEPGLGTLAAAARHGSDPGLLWRHASSLPAGGAVVVAPTDPVQCRSSIGSVGPRVPQMALAERIDAVFDRGRVPNPTGDGLCALSDRAVTLVVCRPDLAGIEHTARVVRRLRSSDPEQTLAVVTVGDRPYGPGDATAATDGTAAWSIPWEPAGATTLLTGPARRARRTALVRAARSLVENVAAGVTA